MSCAQHETLYTSQTWSHTLSMRPSANATVAFANHDLCQRLRWRSCLVVPVGSGLKLPCGFPPAFGLVSGRSQHFILPFVPGASKTVCTIEMCAVLRRLCWLVSVKAANPGRNVSANAAPAACASCNSSDRFATTSAAGSSSTEV